MLTACSRVSLSLVLSLSAAGSRGTPRLDSSPPDRQPARLLGNGNPGAGVLRSRQPGELQGRPRRRWACGAEPGVGARVPTPADNAAWQGTLLAGHGACRASGNLRAQGALGSPQIPLRRHCRGEGCGWGWPPPCLLLSAACWS